jgi:hypothetical protein
VAAAVAELARVVHVGRVVVAQLGGAHVDVHRGDAAVGDHVVDPGLGDAHLRLAVAEVEEAAGGAHGPEGGGGDHVHLLGRRLQAAPVDIVDHLLGGEHHGLAGGDFFVDFRVRLGHSALFG